MSLDPLYKPVIIVVAFSRPRALKRLLISLNKSSFQKKVSLIISLDGGASPEVVSVAEYFDFLHGSVEVIKRSVNLGLRKHILWCGDQSEKYGSVIILEDDLSVDTHFYEFAENALNFYRSDPLVAGISLYSQKFNEYAGLPFEPLWNGSSSYPMSVASSWGQAWSREQWTKFKKWYQAVDNNSISKSINVPDYLKKWPESSWKKYYSTYIADNKLYFIYPYFSYTTNSKDKGGSHDPVGSSILQVPLGDPRRRRDNFNFLNVNESTVIYDSFMEIDSKYLEFFLNISSVEIDLYGTKSIELIQSKKYCITIKNSSRPLAFYPLKFKPHELNIIHSEDEALDSYSTLSLSKDIYFSKIKFNKEYFIYWAYFNVFSRKYYKIAASELLKKLF